MEQTAGMSSACIALAVALDLARHSEIVKEWVLSRLVEEQSLRALQHWEFEIASDQARKAIQDTNSLQWDVTVMGLHFNVTHLLL